MAVIAPVLFLLLLGVADFGRALDLQIEVTGASRAGMRTGIAGNANDVGGAVRGEPNSAIPNDDVTWGTEGPNGIYSCSNTATSCGDPLGCQASSFATGQLVCFAVRSCPRFGNSYPTSACNGWNTRPAPSSNDALDVLVVYRYHALTPVMARLNPSATFYLHGETRGVEVY